MKCSEYPHGGENPVPSQREITMQKPKKFSEKASADPHKKQKALRKLLNQVCGSKSKACCRQLPLGVREGEIEALCKSNPSV
jgi:hypothetical protein